MKKSSVLKCGIIVGLLLLCVTTLLAVYSVVPETSTILLFEDNFNVFDETKWEQQTSKCKENGDHFYYVNTDAENGYIEDGVLRIHPTANKETVTRAKRGATTECYSCVNSENNDEKCIEPVYSTKLQTKNSFDAKNGKIELRVKFPGDNWIKAFVGVTPNNTESEDDEDFEGFHIIELADGGDNNSAELRVFFGPTTDTTVLNSTITKSQFHFYEIEWMNEKITFKIDHRKVGEKITDFSKFKEAKNVSVPEGVNDTISFYQPFYLNFGVTIGQKSPPSDHAEQKRSSGNFENSAKDKSLEEDALEVDFIRLFELIPTE